MQSSCFYVSPWLETSHSWLILLFTTAACISLFLEGFLHLGVDNNWTVKVFWGKVCPAFCMDLSWDLKSDQLLSHLIGRSKGNRQRRGCLSGKGKAWHPHPQGNEESQVLIIMCMSPWRKGDSWWRCLHYLPRLPVLESSGCERELKTKSLVSEKQPITQSGTWDSVLWCSVRSLESGPAFCLV